MVKCYRCYWDSENEQICDRCGSDLIEQHRQEERLHKIAEQTYQPPRKKSGRRMAFLWIAALCVIAMVPLQLYAQKLGERNALITMAVLFAVLVVSIVFAAIPSKRR